MSASPTVSSHDILRGDPRAIARAITLIESGDPRAVPLMQQIFPHTGRAVLAGVTGAAGSGKSTLIAALAAELRKQNHTVGILAIDPTSPFTGGALLGDRIRMQALSEDPGVFIRSLATRGALGGISAATLDAALVLDAAGKDYVLIETVGVGQDEVEIARLADVTLLLQVPHMGDHSGDEVQLFKAGIMEIADLFVLNKSDLPGADRLEQQLSSLLESTPETSPWRAPVVKTIAASGEGVAALLAEVQRYLEFARASGSFDRRRIAAWRAQILQRLREGLLAQLRSDLLSAGDLDTYAGAVAARRRDPYSLTAELLQNLAPQPRNSKR